MIFGRIRQWLLLPALLGIAAATAADSLAIPEQPASGHPAPGHPASLQCYLPHLPSKPLPTLWDAFPFNFLTKSWLASAGMKAHFDLQKALFKQLSQETKTFSSDHQQLHLGSVGDLMRLPTRQDFVDPRVKNYLAEFDLLLGNLETLITASQPMPPPTLYLMNSYPELLTSFNLDSGRSVFNALSLANNHTYDYDDQAISDTIDRLTEHNIATAGFDLEPTGKGYLILEQNNIKVGYYAITTLMNNLTAMQESKLPFNPLLEGIDSTPFRQRADSSCHLDFSNVQAVLDQMEADGMDFKVLSLHWGFEHEMYPRPAQMQVARDLMSLGFDVIFGAHTHTPQPAEICYLNGYESAQPNNCRLNTTDGRPRKAVVFYSLGNFNSYSNVFWQQVGTIASLTLVKSDAGKDWYSPDYKFTYDHTLNPPNGPQQLTFLDQQGISCPWQHCANNLAAMAQYPQDHMTGESLSSWQELWRGWRSLMDTLGSFLYWTLRYQGPEQDQVD